MEEKLIVCVAAYPVLFDASLFSYLDVNKKNDAWRRVTDDVGVPAEVCKETFKYLLDSYKREKNREKELSRCGAGLTNHKPWKYAALMGFLAPFLEVEQTARQPDSEPESPASEARASTVSQATLSSQTPASSGRKRVLILVALKRAQAPASQPTPQAEDEDYLFFKSLLPALKRLPPAKRSELKCNIHRMFFEAEAELHASQSDVQ